MLVRFSRIKLRSHGNSSSSSSGGADQQLQPRWAAVITLVDADKSAVFEWGTRIAEHRLNPQLIVELHHALDNVTGDAKEKCSCLIVTNEGKHFCNGLDLKYIDTLPSDEEVDECVDRVNKLMVRLLHFPVPTICAANGHWCAAGGMLGLTFDYRVMSTDRGYFFIPGVDLGIEYSQFQMALMMMKLPSQLHRDVIVMNRKRWTAEELVPHGLVDAVAESKGLLTVALNLASAVARPDVDNNQAEQSLKTIKKAINRQITTALGNGGGKMTLHNSVRRRGGLDRAAPPRIEGQSKL